MMEIIEIEPVAVQLSFDYSEYPEEARAKLRRHSANLYGIAKRATDESAYELYEAKQEIHRWKKDGWTKWAESSECPFSVRHADRIIKQHEEKKFGHHVRNLLPEAAPRLDLPIPVLVPESGPAYGPFEHGQDLRVRDEDEDEYSRELTEEDRYMAQVDIGFTEYSRDGHDLVKELDKRNGVPAALLSSDSNEWYTPEEYVHAARELMGGIDLDPASCAFANETIKAARYYDSTINGLNQSWKGSVWLNPPYGIENGVSNQELWTRTLIQRFEINRTVTEAVLLVNANTEAKWFQPLYDYLICLTNHRIRFYNGASEASQPTQGNALVYFGTQRKRFIELFSRFGTVIERAK